MTTLGTHEAPHVTLHEASAADAPLLENLLQLYIHDLSALFTQVELGEDGRYSYPSLASFLSGAPDRRAFVVRAGGRLAGFVLAKRGSPALSDPQAWDVAEFFVLRRYRRAGVGRAAARGLWAELGGAWAVRVAHKNAAALSFWRSAVAEYRGGAVLERAWSQGAEPWTVFHLQPNE